MHAASAALPAFAFQAMTASDRTARWALAGATTAVRAVAAMAPVRSARVSERVIAPPACGRATRTRRRQARQHEHRACAAGADRGGAPVEALVDRAHDRRIGWLRPGGGAGLGVEGLGNRRGGGERAGDEARRDQAGDWVRVVIGHAA